MNPLKLPHRRREAPRRKNLRPANWSSGNTAQPLPHSAERLTHKEILARQAMKAEHQITVEVRAVKGLDSGKYTMAHVPGQNLGQYLATIKLKNTAAKNAIYDTAHLTRGRLRLTYVLEPDSAILIGPPQYGPLTHLQRAKHRDAMPFAKNMAGGAKVAEFSFGYGSGHQKPTPSPKTPRQGALDDLDIDQF